ncbi:hypothetical protein GCM10007160_41240 [Litchfieldella qijiaojingensis]|uniref:Polysaccharide chain length determinant N-terminal domain-containing protein n=1 Tax=Litchfieldella qijiaojingensis TaxID=980347 RepID=A0ABQ2ZA54_9GAMM|nr:hypothetical protein [Halomonas qijiaojingensis]GGY09656.1 hypothetical protein GCM10007160_41240 [Halomonas qijiaojingensis]
MSPPPPANDEDTSLVELAALLVKRWKAMLAIFLAVTLVASAFALLKPTKYRYTSIYQIAEYQNQDGDIEALESPGAVLTQIRSLVLPTATRAFLADHDAEAMPFPVDISQPSGTRLVVLQTETTQDQARNVEIVHSAVLEGIRSLQNRRFERLRQSLESRLATHETALADTSGEGTALLVEEIARLEDQLAAMQEGEISQLAVVSLEPVGLSRGVIIGSGVLLAIVLAVLGVFILHFAGLVRNSLRHEH